MRPGLAEHPSPEQLSAFGLGNLDPQAQAAVEQHVAACGTCCDALRQVRNDTLVDLIRQAHSPAEVSETCVLNTPPQHAILPPDTPPELSEHAKYRIISRLGAGGMGVVYRAEHRLMERLVALKVISPEILDHPQAVERFRQEVKAAAKLLHPNIVAAHDAEQAGELHFLVMEYVDGTSLARVVEKRGPLPVLHACHYIRQAALGLQHAHQHGMVHRDIKPQNLMLSRRGQVKILDFGLARLAREHDAGAEPHIKAKARATLTSLGTVLGTPDYIAPEQASDSRKADIRSDIYSLGCTLYFLLTGRVPFPGGSSVEKLMQHSLDRPAALADLRRDVPAELAAVVEKMMAKKPEDRYQTPAGVAAALLPFARSTSARAGGKDEPLAVAMLLDDADTLPAIKGVDTFVERPQRERARSRSHFRPRRQSFLTRHSARLIGLGAMLLVLAGAATAFVKYALPLLQEKQKQEVSPSVNNDPPRGGERKRAEEVEEPRSSKPGGGAAAPIAPPARPAAAGGKRVLIVLASRGFYYPDYGPVKNILESSGGIVVTTAASVAGPAKPMSSDRFPSVTPEITLARARAEDFDLVVFCGGVGVLDEYCQGGPQHEAAKNFIQEMLNRNKYVTALCGGPAVLADAGVLKGIRATCYMGDQRYVRKLMAGGALKGEGNIVESGKIITGRDPEAAKEFAGKLVALLRDGS